jgi:putative SOS response-associated peptidase YedK
MCERFALKATIKDVEKLVPKIKIQNEIRNSFNIAPTASIACLKGEGDSVALSYFRWGLIPSWAKDSSIGNKMINARSESLADKVSFKRLLNRYRCIILASGFYEWYKAGNDQIPHYITMKNDELMCFAGLYDNWKNENNEIITTATIITTEPNSLMAMIYNRMPVILDPDDINSWLDNKVDFNMIRDILKPIHSNKLRAYPVSYAVNNPQYNIIDCLTPQGADLVVS